MDRQNIQFREYLHTIIVKMIIFEERWLDWEDDLVIPKLDVHPGLIKHLVKKYLTKKVKKVVVEESESEESESESEESEEEDSEEKREKEAIAKFEKYLFSQ